MSKKVLVAESPPQLNKNKYSLKDCRDVELTFLKKANEVYSAISSPCHSEQGGKRGRTPSDNDNDPQDMGYGLRKRSRSSQRKPRMIVNSIIAGTNTSNRNYVSPKRLEQEYSQSNNKQDQVISGAEDKYKFDITNNAIYYAVNQSLPFLKFECEPTVKDQHEGTKIIKELFKAIYDDFKQMNPKHSDIIGFESWFIDTKGNICGTTRDLHLFTYLCDVEKIPRKILDKQITPVLPKHLPPQCSIIIKGVPNTLSNDEIKWRIEDKYKSVYAIADLIGTNNGRTRHLRIDLLNQTEYNQLINTGAIYIEGLCLHVYEYLAAPRVMFCSICNLPGHNKKSCQHPYERCKRCGSDRNIGDHSECEIICHNCKGRHLSTDFICPAIRSYRREVIKRIQLHPEILPDHVQIFIPTYCRQDGVKVLSNQRKGSQYQQYINPTQNYSNAVRNWPSLPQPINNTITYLKSQQRQLNHNDQINDMQVQMNKLENECENAKREFDKKNMDIITKFNTSTSKIMSLIIGCTTVIQRQNEMIVALKSAVNECLKNSKTTNKIICSLMNKKDDLQQYSDVIEQLATIPIDDRCVSVEKMFATYSPLIDDFTKKIMEVTNQLLLTNER